MSWKQCPECGKRKVHCIDSRWRGTDTRRRYACLNKRCGHRFTTLEDLVKDKTRAGNKIRTIASIEKDRLMAKIEGLLRE